MIIQKKVYNLPGIKSPSEDLVINYFSFNLYCTVNKFGAKMKDPWVKLATHNSDIGLITELMEQ